MSGRWRVSHPASEATATPTVLRTSGYANDAAGLLDHLGLTGVVVLGHSLGSVNAYQRAARGPDLVRALIIEDLGAEVDDDLSFGLTVPPTHAALLWKDSARQGATTWMPSASTPTDGGLPSAGRTCTTPSSNSMARTGASGLPAVVPPYSCAGNTVPFHRQGHGKAASQHLPHGAFDRPHRSRDRLRRLRWCGPPVAGLPRLPRSVTCTLRPASPSAATAQRRERTGSRRSGRGSR
ncbi:alpha/beta fold hydrolase [Streptomyces flaveolus]|uniref:alpha/beta fold hydrolase n=1 Tax=Streptomyces flaveolus TaxID=67297 RepID=UPI0038157D1A